MRVFTSPIGTFLFFLYLFDSNTTSVSPESSILTVSRLDVAHSEMLPRDTSDGNVAHWSTVLAPVLPAADSATMRDLPAIGTAVSGSQLDRFSNIPPELRLRIYDIVFASILHPVLDPRTSFNPQTCSSILALIRVSTLMRDGAPSLWAEQLSIAHLEVCGLSLSYPIAINAHADELMASEVWTTGPGGAFMEAQSNFDVFMARSKELRIPELCAKTSKATRTPCASEEGTEGD
ncbi:hypothetical protein LTR95_004167 [Oleoguttula sp. CCFEE 5521]